MATNKQVYDQLVEMGIDHVLATGASSRFSSVAPAIEWCFGPGGQSYKPEDDRPPTPPAYQPAHLPGVSVTHHEVADTAMSASTSAAPSPRPISSSSVKWLPEPPPRHPSTSPALPPRLSPKPSVTLASNNPFRQSAPDLTPISNLSTTKDTSVYSHLPPPPAHIDDDDDEELRRALAMSTESMDTGDEDKRHERERSVRASGVPPPSPEGDETQVNRVLFGPSEKNDMEGNMALIPATPGPGNQVSKEEEDMNRAIADSLMTASFHSASALQTADRPVARPRQPDAPVVLYSESGQSTYMAHLVQGLLAIPQFRLALSLALPDPSYPNLGTGSRFKVACEEQLSSADDFVSFEPIRSEILRHDGKLDGLNQLPPSEPACRAQLAIIEMVENCLRATGQSLDGMPEKEGKPYLHEDEHESLFYSKINIEPPVRDAWYVHLNRTPGTELRLYNAVANILWGTDTEASVESFGDILSVRLTWSYDSPRIPWTLEERIVLDRFLRVNARRSTNVRAMQSLAKANVRRMKERLDTLVSHKGESTIDSLTTLIKHFEMSTSGKDPLEKESQEEMKAKLEKILEAIQTQRAELVEGLEVEEKKAGPDAFDVSYTELQEHPYILRAVLFHDGALVAGSHLYMYVRQDDSQWWKIQDHQATKVDFETIVNDRTGLFMDGGPYLMLYSRDGTRPAVREEELSQPSSTVLDTKTERLPDYVPLEPAKAEDTSDTVKAEGDEM